MKLLMAIVQDRDMPALSRALVAAGCRFTRIGSTGGFLREGNTTIVMGLEDEQVEAALAVVSANCHTREQCVNMAPPDAAPLGVFVPAPVQVQVGGAVVFVLPVERCERL